MKAVLAAVLNELDAIAMTRSEVTDTEVRERMWAAIERMLLSPDEGYSLPQDFGMYRRKGNRAVRAALAAFHRDACASVVAAGRQTRAERLKAFQDGSVLSDGGSTYDKYFGHDANADE